MLGPRWARKSEASGTERERRRRFETEKKWTDVSGPSRGRVGMNKGRKDTHHAMTLESTKGERDTRVY